MPITPGDPLTKVTLNLYTADVNWMRHMWGEGWSAQLRELVKNSIKPTRHTIGDTYEHD